MNNNQKFVLLFGIVVTILIVLFPPWKSYSTYTRREIPDVYNLGAYTVTEYYLKGYKFIATPPRFNNSQIDLQRLVIQFCALVVIVGALFFIFQTKRKIYTEMTDKCRECGRKIAENERACIVEGELVCSECERKDN